MGIDYLGVELSMEVRLSILERLKANEGGLEAEELQELGLYTEYRNVAAGMAALLEASYCGSRFEQTLYSIDELRRADRQAEVQMLLRFFENTTIMASVQDYNAAGSAIREKGATVAAPGYESVPSDFEPFNFSEIPGKFDIQLTGTIHEHHLLPRQFKSFFSAAGLNIENYKIPLDAAQHTLKPYDIHTGAYDSSWNGIWSAFFKRYPNATSEQILKQLEIMRNMFGI